MLHPLKNTCFSFMAVKGLVYCYQMTGGFLGLQTDASWVYQLCHWTPCPPCCINCAYTICTLSHIFTRVINRMYALETQVCKLDLSGGIHAGARLRALTQMISTIILPDHACT